MDQAHRGMLDALNASFDAALAHAEDEAADDLAFSLMQDEGLADLLTRRKETLVKVPGSSWLPVSRIGADFLVGGPQDETIVPFTNAVVRTGGGGATASQTTDLLVALLRKIARASLEVEICCHGDVYKGRLLRASSELIEVAVPGGSIVAALGTLEWVKVIRLGSMDDS